MVMSLNAGNTINIRGTVYDLDTMYHAKVGPGTTQTHLALQNAAGSKLQVYYLTIDKRTPNVSIRTVCATDKVAGSETVRTMATRKSGNGTLYFAGVNGDFYSTSGTSTNGKSVVGTPTASCFVDREVYKTSNSNYQFSIDINGVARVGRHDYYTGTATIGDKVTLFKGINVTSPNNGITIYSPRYWGSSNQEERAGACNEVTAKLVAGDNFYAGTKFRLEVTSSPTTDGDTPIPSDGFVIHGRGTSTDGCNTGALDFVGSLQVGDVVEFDHVVLYDPIAGGDVDLRIVPAQVISGNPKIVGEGVTLDTESERTDASTNHPRTAIGVSQSGDSIIMMVIDGRSLVSAGVTTSRLGDVMRYAGAWEAVNIDGGGSSTLYTSAFGVRNECSDGSERAVGNAIFATIDAPEDNEIAELQFKDWSMAFPKYGVYKPVVYGYNKYGVLIDTDVQDFTLSCPPELGEVLSDGKTFFGTGSGTHALTATYNGVEAKLPVTIEESSLPEMKYSRVILDNYREWPVDVQSLVRGGYMPLNPMALDWSTSNGAVVSIDEETGVARGLKDGVAVLTGYVDTFSGDVEVEVQCPTNQVMPIDRTHDVSRWKITKSNVGECAATANDNGVDLVLKISSVRAPSVTLTADSLLVWSLPDALKLRINPGDLTVSTVVMRTTANNGEYIDNRLENLTLTANAENEIVLPISQFADTTDIGIYPIRLNSLVFMIKGTTGKEYRLSVPGIEAVYYNAPSGIEDVLTDGATAQEIGVNDGVVTVAGDVVEAIDVYNIAGQLVAGVKNANKIKLPEAGCYVVKAIVDGKEITGKVIM